MDNPVTVCHPIGMTREVDDRLQWSIFGPMRLRASLFLTTVLLVLCHAHAQVGVTTFGLQLKPVIPFGFFDPLTTLQQEHLTGTLELRGGLAFGMTVRTGISKSISLEAGIDQITRRYQFGIANDTSGYTDSGSLRFVGYEIPITCLVYVRLGERTWMNNALGVSIDFYPGDAKKELELAQAYLFRRNWAQFGVVGNIGVEYRTEKSGYFYLGATFHRPFGDMAQVDITWLDRYAGLRPYRMSKLLSGSYLTLDLRYYFHEDPNKAKLRKSRGK